MPKDLIRDDQFFKNVENCGQIWGEANVLCSGKKWLPAL